MDFWCYIKSWLIFSGDYVASLTGIKKILVAFLKIVKPQFSNGRVGSNSVIIMFLIVSTTYNLLFIMHFL